MASTTTVTVSNRHTTAFAQRIEILAVVSVTAIRESAGYSESDGGSEYSYTGAYDVLTDDFDDGPQVVLAAANLPQPLTAYSFGNDSDTSAFLVGRSPTRHFDQDLLWRVVCTWSNKTDVPRDESTGNPTTDASLWRTKWTTGGTPRQKDITAARWVRNSDGSQIRIFDAARNDGVLGPNQEGPIRGLYGEVITPTPQMDDDRMWYRAVWYEYQTDMAYYDNLRNTVNAGLIRKEIYNNSGDPMFDPISKEWAPETCKMVLFQRDEEELYGELYNRLTAQFEYDPNGWHHPHFNTTQHGRQRAIPGVDKGPDDEIFDAYVPGGGVPEIAVPEQAILGQDFKWGGGAKWPQNADGKPDAGASITSFWEVYRPADWSKIGW